MKAKELRELISTIPDDAEVIMGTDFQKGITPYFKAKVRFKQFEGPEESYTKNQIDNLPWGEWMECSYSMYCNVATDFKEYKIYGDPVYYIIGT